MGFKFKELFTKHEDRGESREAFTKTPVIDNSSLDGIKVNNVASYKPVKEDPKLEEAVNAVVITEDSSPTKQESGQRVQQEASSIPMPVQVPTQTQQSNGANLADDLSMPSLEDLHATPGNADVKPLVSDGPDTSGANLGSGIENPLKKDEVGSVPVNQEDSFSGG